MAPLTTTERVSPALRVAVPAMVGGVTLVVAMVTVGTAGAVVSMTMALLASSEPAACETGRVRERLLPAVSLTVALLSRSAVALRSAAVSPDCTV